ncbi:MAG: SDR family NAD(P)-dependent oxidoreductase, partial [Clostridia bacterium]|nr:SDR family NAD(P)-dependent oxidoreductase [Clostridia bacterium]
AWPGWSVYTAAKWGVLGFTKGLTTELGPHGVRVTCLVPGAGDTNFDKNADFAGRGATPMLKAEDIAQAVFDIYNLPKHVWVEEMTVWGIDQVVMPL